MTLAGSAAPLVLAIQDSKVSPGVLGFLVVATLGVATWLLIRSMNRQIHKIDFSEDAVDLARKQASLAEPEIIAGARSPEVDPEGPAPAAADGDDGPAGGDRPPG